MEQSTDETQCPPAKALKRRSQTLVNTFDPDDNKVDADADADVVADALRLMLMLMLMLMLVLSQWEKSQKKKH